MLFSHHLYTITGALGEEGDAHVVDDPAAVPQHRQSRQRPHDGGGQRHPDHHPRQTDDVREPNQDIAGLHDGAFAMDYFDDAASDLRRDS